MYFRYKIYSISKKIALHITRDKCEKQKTSAFGRFM